MYGSCLITPIYRLLRGHPVRCIRQHPRFHTTHFMWRENGRWYHFTSHKKALNWYQQLFFKGEVEELEGENYAARTGRK